MLVNINGFTIWAYLILVYLISYGGFAFRRNFRCLLPAVTAPSLTSFSTLLVAVIFVIGWLVCLIGYHMGGRHSPAACFCSYCRSSKRYARKKLSVELHYSCVRSESEAVRLVVPFFIYLSNLT